MERFWDANLINGLSIDSEWPSFSISGGKVRDQVNNRDEDTSDGNQDTLYKYTPGTVAFGAMVSTAEAGEGEGIKAAIIKANDIEVWGFIADFPFTKVEFANPEGGVQETYTLDNLILCQPACEWKGCWYSNGPCRHLNYGDTSCAGYVPGTETCTPGMEKCWGINQWIPKTGPPKPKDCTGCWYSSGQCYANMGGVKVCWPADNFAEGDGCPPNTTPCN